MNISAYALLRLILLQPFLGINFTTFFIPGDQLLYGFHFFELAFTHTSSYPTGTMNIIFHLLFVNIFVILYQSAEDF